VILLLLPQVPSNVGAVARARGSRDVQDLPLLRCVGYVLELAVAGYLKLSELLDQVINRLPLIVQRLIRHAHQACAIDFCSRSPYIV
jgi:hypothetical protein